VLLKMSVWWVTNLALVIAAAIALVAGWRPARLPWISARSAIRVLSILVFVRFAVPVFVLGSTLVFDTFLATQQQLANDALTVTGREIEELTEEPAEPDAGEPSFTERLGNLVDDSLQALDVRARMAVLQASVSGAVRHVVDLIVIFALQAIILPLVFLWLFAEALKKIAARTAHL
jgi:hypothetical protein